MIEEKDKMKDLFSSKLKDFEGEVPVSVWEGLDQILSAQTSAPPVARRSKLRLNIIKAASIAACLTAIVIIAATIIMMPSDDIEPLNVKTKISNLALTQKEEIPPIKAPIKTRTYIPPEKEAEIPAVEEVIRTENIVVEKRERLYARSRVNDIYHIDESGIKIKGEEELTTRRSKGGLYTRAYKSDKENTEVGKTKKETKETERMLAGLKPEEKKFAIGLASNFGLSDNGMSQNGGVMLFSDKYINKANPDLQSVLAESDAVYDLDHNLPVSFGLKFSKQIAPRFALETGVVYTYLSSTIKTQNSFVLDEKQKFHYLGLPLSINYIFWQQGDVQFYTSLGILVQKDISGRYISTLKTDQSLTTEKGKYVGNGSIGTKESIHQDNLQFSSNLTIGVSYPIYRSLYLYGTIGGAYYFDANNKYRTIYSDKKTQLDLNFGLRLGF